MNIAVANNEGFSDFLTYLVERDILSIEAKARAQAAHSSTNHPADTVLIELGLTRENNLALYFSEFLDLPVVEQLPNDIDPALIVQVDLNFLESNQVLPIGFEDEKLVVAVADPFSLEPINAISYLFERSTTLRIFPRSAIVDRIRELKTGQDESSILPVSAIDISKDSDTDDIDRLRDFAREAPIIRFVSRIIQQAVDIGATDLHIEPLADHVRIRFRRDGLLTKGETAPREMHAGISTRIKILSRLNIAERRMPQDGRMRIAVRGQEIDLRVSVLPSIHGETFVLRVLDRSGVDLRLEALGYEESAIATLRDLIQLPNGIILVTGPTGSGKTTTLYSMLKERDASEVKIFTVEDPVEYRLDGITQMQVDPAIDISFAKALRSVLRQDPDIILIGEIRDRESAQIAIQASLTGHLVFSTLHTNSAAGALTRLRDMGVDDYLIGATIRAIIGQRLVRKTCGKCGGLPNPKPDKQQPNCAQCQGTGYFGRTVTYEIAQMSSQFSEIISQGADEEQLNKHAIQTGMVPMASHAAKLAENGVTTRKEIRRVLELGGF